ncbi:MAG: hypothetical protein RR800_00400 [Comamonas sp.]
MRAKGRFRPSPRLRAHLDLVIGNLELAQLRRLRPRKSAKFQAYSAIDRALSMNQTHDPKFIQDRQLRASLCFELLKTQPEEFTFDSHWRLLFTWFSVYLHVCLQRKRKGMQAYANHQLAKVLAGGRRALRKAFQLQQKTGQWTTPDAEGLELLSTAMVWSARVSEKSTCLEITNAYKSLDANSKTANRFGRT